MEYRVFPSIGIARLGNSDEVFVGPEVIGSRGREFSGTEVASFKDAQFRIRKQAARFYVFQRNDAGSPWVPLPAGAVKWTVQLANKKDAVKRPLEPIDSLLSTPTLKVRITPDTARVNRLINAGDSIQSNAPITAEKKLIGTHVLKPVKLGSLRVDNQGHLLVLGGDIDSGADPTSSSPW